MTGLKSFAWALWLLACLAVAPFGRGQMMAGFSADGPPPPRPAFNVQDNAGLYTRNPEGLRVISDRLRGLEQQHGFHLYVVTESVVMGATPVDLAARLQQAWLPEGDGVVLVYEVDTRAFGMGRPYDSGNVTKPGNGARIPSFVAAGVVERVRSQLASDQQRTLDSQALLDHLTGLLVNEFGGYLEASRGSAIDAPTARIFWIGAGAAVVLGGLGWWIARRARRAEVERRRTYRFPPVPDQQRLGAPFGAMVSSRPFRGSASLDRQ
ncbi:TPM domain-containing protein [Luteolibacter sp. LG18]|uniref:TPM domain-containing protein n=1 Tax=Luteolibacter sp. LG18 TaxID=2819286 RepID=UPI002B2E6845|nr:hypothetical protein llg_07990 [Luteolibacter sp. LG18]